MSRSRLIFIVFYLTGILILTVLTRTNSSRIFLRYRQAAVIQKRRDNQLRDRQIILASLTTPERISRKVKELSESDDD